MIPSMPYSLNTRQWSTLFQHSTPCNTITEPSGAAPMSSMRPEKSRPTVLGSKYLYE